MDRRPNAGKDGVSVAIWFPFDQDIHAAICAPASRCETVPIVVNDPFGNERSYFATGIVPKVTLAPDVAQAYSARERVVRFFRSSL